MQASNHYGIVGQTAPELSLSGWIDGDGEPTSFALADHPGKWVFLKCFQSWCPGCHSHGLPAFKEIAHHFANNSGIAFAGIQTVFEGFGVNTPDKVRETQLRYELDVPMVHDAGADGKRSQTMIDYRTGGTPWMIVITPDREVVFNDFGIDVAKAIEFLETQI
ncbi:MAG: thiol-disulfide isomerase/thioredoxin [Parasphingorhabdus sp.]